MSQRPHLWKRISLTMLLCVTAAAGFSAAAEKKMIIRVDKGNIREDASIQGKVNAQVSRGEAVTVLETAGDWRRVQLSDGKTGWARADVLGDTLEDAAPIGQTVTPAVDFVTVRKGPSVKSEPIGALKKKVPITALGIENGWYRLELAGGETGYAHEMLFAPDASAGYYRLKGIRIEDDGAGEEKIFFAYDGPRPPRTVLADARKKRTQIVCEFRNTSVSEEIRKRHAVKGALIESLHISRSEDNPMNTRVVFDLSPDGEYRLQHLFFEERLYLLIVKKI